MTRMHTRTALVVGLALATLAPSYAGAEPPVEPEEDLTAPTITITPPAGGVGGWYSSMSLDVHVQATDAGGLQTVAYSLIGAQTGAGTVPNVGGRAVRISSTGLTTLAVEATDRAGNSATAEVTVGIDRGQPWVQYAGRVQPGAVFALGEQVALEYSCGDNTGESGLASCVGPVPSGGLLDTSVLDDNRTVSVTATDRVGWQTTRIVHYAVVEPDFEVVSAPTVSGGSVVGDELTGLAGEFTPTPTTIDYTWHRDGVAIPGATGLSYLLRGADAGHQVTLVATAKRGAFNDGRSESAPVSVTPGELQLSELPTIVGDVRVGSELTVDHPPVFPGGSTTSYAWLRDGTPIPGATGATYRLGAADVGHRIVAVVKGTMLGYHPGTWTTTPTAAVPAVILRVTGRPAVSGRPAVGSTLTAALPRVRAAAELPTSVTTLVQWLRDGRTIPGATDRTYRPGVADAGHRLAVRVTASAPGHLPVALTSRATAPTAKAKPTLRVTARATARVVLLTIRATAPGATPSGAVVVKARGTVVARGVLRKGRLTIRLTGQKPGRTTYTATYAGGPGISGGSASTAVLVR
jgi:hypothetical protein